MIKRKLLTLSMAFLLFTSVGLGNSKSLVFADTTTESDSNQETKEALENVVKKVKPRINIPKECTIFDYDIDINEYGETEYTLTWSNEYDTTSVCATADIEGNITYYRLYEPYKDTLKITYLKSELEEKAKAQAVKINPVMKGHMELTSSSYTGTYYNSYEYTFTRMENGYPMNNNSFVVELSAETGEVVYYRTEWLFNADIPSNKANITEQAAKEQLKKSLDMELAYRTSYSWDGDICNKKAYLVYLPSKSYVAVDAKTGMVYLNNQEWNVTNSKQEDATTEEKSDSNTGSSSLTEEEITAIDVLDSLIDQKTAISKITSNKSLLLDQHANAITARLVLRGEDYYWNLTFEDPREVDYENDDLFRSYVRATVDAKTGEILYYYANVDDSIDYKAKGTILSDNACQKKFEAFVKTQNTDRLKNSVLAETRNDYILDYLDDASIIYGGTQFTYNRINEGIPYEDNCIYGDVDRITGKVYYYNFYWDEDLVFESPKEAMSSEEALNYYVNLPGIDLVYEDNVIVTYDEAYEDQEEYYYNEDAYQIDHQIRFVYSTENIQYGRISPFTGKELDYQGNEVVEAPKYISGYKDVAGNPYERDILLLSDIGLGYQSEKFSPNALITNNEMMQFMQAAGLYLGDSTTILNDYQVSRQQAAKLVINTLGLTNIANMNSIFTTGYTDEAKISKNALGAVALCKGLNLVQFGENNTFGPSEKLTRAQAAKIIMELFVLENSDSYSNY